NTVGDSGNMAPASSCRLRQSLAHPIGDGRAGPVGLVRATVVAVRITEELAPRRPLRLALGLLPWDQAVELAGDVQRRDLDALADSAQVKGHRPLASLLLGLCAAFEGETLL